MSASPSSSLLDIAHLIDESLVDDPADVAFYVVDDPHDVVLGVHRLHDHPCVALAGLTAAPDWRAFGLRVHGTAHFLDGSRGPEPIATTYLLGRDGTSISILRRGAEVTEDLTGARGRIPDLCRQILASAVEAAS
ncbi:MAG: hypothetical protein M3Z03_00205 [Actinomycetota bacterium]|nr:hypothetical protein [Actinomycetota bacterium]